MFILGKELIVSHSEALPLFRILWCVIDESFEISDDLSKPGLFSRPVSGDKFLINR